LLDAILLLVGMANVSFSAGMANNSTKIFLASSEAQARILFASHAGLYYWNVLNYSTILIQDIGGCRYLTRMHDAMYELEFAEKFGFIT